MEVSQTQTLPPPPGIINSIRSGFDRIAVHISVILLPVALDLFMWLGPRLQLRALFDSFKADVVSIWQSGGMPAEEIQQGLDFYESAIPGINLFWLLRTFPTGIPSLLYPHSSSPTPLGSSVNWQVGALDFPAWIFLLIGMGWIGGALYYRSVVGVAVPAEGEKMVSVVPATFQTALISIFSGVVVTVIGVPVLLILLLIAQANAVLANLFMLVISLGSMWMVVPLFFWPHGIFLKKQNVFTSILTSIQLARYTLPTSSLFVLTVFLISFGLNLLWVVPPENSWLTLFGIFGHAYVTTALLASSFIYYHEMTAWLAKAMEKFRSTSTVKQA